MSDTSKPYFSVSGRHDGESYQMTVYLDPVRLVVEGTPPPNLLNEVQQQVAELPVIMSATSADPVRR